MVRPKRQHAEWEADALQSKGGLWPTTLGRASFGAASALGGYPHVTTGVPAGHVPGAGVRLAKFARDGTPGGLAAGLTVSAETARPAMHIECESLSRQKNTTGRQLF